MLYCHLQHHNDTIITDAMTKTHAGKLLYKYIPLTLLQGFEKGYSSFASERVLETEHKLQYFDLHSYGRQRCVFLVLLMLNRSPGVHSAGCWLSLLHLISIFSGPQLIRASRGPSRPNVTFPTTSRLTLSPTLLQLHWHRNSTQLYNRSTLTRSLKSNV